MHRPSCFFMAGVGSEDDGDGDAHRDSSPVQNVRSSMRGRRGSTRGRRTSNAASTVEMAAVLQRQLQQRMFGARQGTYAHSDAAALLLARRVRGEALTIRERLFLFLEEPGASRGAF